MKWTVWLLATVTAVGQEARITAPRIWDDKALEAWATPIAALGIRPRHFTAAEYYAIPGNNLRTYPVYRPDREPPGYWESLLKQKPQRLVDSVKLRTREDWVRAGEEAFQGLDEVARRTNDPEKIRRARELKSYEGLWTQSNGALVGLRWVVTDHGIELGFTACAICHARGQADGRVLWGAPPKGPGVTPYSNLALASLPNSRSPAFLFLGDSRPLQSWRNYTVPWDPDPRIERLRTASEAEDQEFRRNDAPPFIGVVTRPHGSPYYPTKTPDLNSVRFSRYIDATGTHRLRGPEDIARYAALVTGADPMEFGSYKILNPEQRRVPMRYADEVLYAIAVYLMSLEPPRNPDVAPTALVESGRQVFVRETCINCHAPPNYTTGKLTLAGGFDPPRDHPNGADIVNVRVATDPGLALKTRKGTGFYKIPSLRGVWYRPLLLHDGSVASLEEMFDPNRLKPDHVPGGWKGPAVTRRSIPGHPFGLALNAQEKAALLAFLRSL
jgi:mono/diheme cytochrome c family protein